MNCRLCGLSFKSKNNLNEYKKRVEIVVRLPITKKNFEKCDMRSHSHSNQNNPMTNIIILYPTASHMCTYPITNCVKLGLTQHTAFLLVLLTVLACADINTCS